MKIIFIIDRLFIFFNVKTNIELAEKLGVSPTSISNWKKRNTIDYNLVFTKCEGINWNWLLSGIGDMLISNAPPTENSCLPCQHCIDKDALIKVLQKTIETQADFIELLKEKSLAYNAGQKRKAS
jgi:hypothetical protein